MCLRIFTQSTTCVHPHLKRSCGKPRTDFQLSSMSSCLSFWKYSKRRKNSRLRGAFANFPLSAVLLHILNVSRNAFIFPPFLCCFGFNAFIQYIEFCILLELKQVFHFSGISGCANDHLHVKNECTHNSASTHKYRKVQNWRLQYAT